MSPRPDIAFADFGTVWLLRGETPKGQEWVTRKINAANLTSIGGAIAIDCRFAIGVIAGAQDDGLTTVLR